MKITLFLTTHCFQGSIMTMAMNDVRSLQVLADVHFGEYIGIGVLAASANVCVVSIL